MGTELDWEELWLSKAELVLSGKELSAAEEREEELSLLSLTEELSEDVSAEVSEEVSAELSLISEEVSSVWEETSLLSDIEERGASVSFTGAFCSQPERAIKAAPNIAKNLSLKFFTKKPPNI